MASVTLTESLAPVGRSVSATSCCFPAATPRRSRRTSWLTRQCGTCTRRSSTCCAHTSLTRPRDRADTDTRAILVPLRLRVRDTVLSLLSTTTVFGTPRDVTLAELAIESFYPADAATAAFLKEKV